MRLWMLFNCFCMILYWLILYSITVPSLSVNVTFPLFDPIFFDTFRKVRIDYKQSTACFAIICFSSRRKADKIGMIVFASCKEFVSIFFYGCYPCHLVLLHNIFSSKNSTHRHYIYCVTCTEIFVCFSN